VSTYAIGDVQGCYTDLMRLLDVVGFDERRDTLWFVGDLVNRGADSLSTLRFVRGLGARARVVLGNHDLHLLAVYFADHPLKSRDTLDMVLTASDCQELLDWLRTCSLCHHDEALGFVMTHAGIPHIWDVDLTLKYAREVETVLRGPNYRDYFVKMYGNEPAVWRDDLRGMARLRSITNYLTRMRLVSESGALELTSKDKPENAPKGFSPWFELFTAPPRLKVVFGHWAALEGAVGVPWAHGVDTGCVWGGGLTALRLDDEELFSVASVQH
jgi:bis(5'-nucleosyl)-tetraphosphatase (symmetrical)